MSTRPRPLSSLNTRATTLSSSDPVALARLYSVTSCPFTTTFLHLAPMRYDSFLLCRFHLFCIYCVIIFAQKFGALFKDTYIGQNPTANRGKFLVLSLSFSSVNVDDVERSFHNYINTMVADFSERYYESGHLDEPIVVNPTNCFDSLTRLLTTVERSGKQVYLIVDEYDAFANRAMLTIDTSKEDLGMEQYRKLMASKESLLLRFGDNMKSHSSTSIGRMFFTGITPLAFWDGLSGLNIVKDISDHPKFTSLVGFTDKDLQVALCKIGINESNMQHHLTKMKSHFNGYRFHANQVDGVYNPQACLYYLCSIVRTGKAPYPILDPNISTPPDNMVQFLVRHASSKEVFKNNHVSMTMTWKEMIFGLVTEMLFINFRCADLLKPDTCERALLSLAYYHGYLTHAQKPRAAIENPYRLASLKCPNLEMQRIMLSTLVLDSKQMYPVINDILDADDVARREKIIEEAIKSGFNSLAILSKDILDKSN
jgi:hypothetical protein